MREDIIIKQLRTLHEVTASEKLKSRINGLTFALPAQASNTYFQVFAFKTAIALAMLLLFVGLGSGIVDAAKNSKPGSPFYPVKQALEKVQAQLPVSATVEKNEAPTPTPKVVSPTPRISISQEQKDNAGEKNDKKETPRQSNNLRKQVKGIQDSIRQYVPFLQNNHKDQDNHQEDKTQEKDHSEKEIELHVNTSLENK